MRLFCSPFLLVVSLLLSSQHSAGAQEAFDFFAAEAAAISQAVERVGPAVVSIEVVGVSEVAAGELAADAPSAGTVIDSSGFILASSLVAERSAASILVVFGDGTRLPAEIVARDSARELVLLKVQTAEPLPAIELVPAEQVRVGDYAIAVGRIGAAGPAARSVGIVSALSRLNGRALQTDARISPPFYGGPLINIRGQLLGFVVPAMPEAGGTGDKVGWYDSGIAFAAPASQVLSRLETLKQGTDIQPGKLGIVAGSSDSLASGTKISAVRIGSPAAQAGIETGDKILAINDVPVERHQQIKEILGPLDAGNLVKIDIDRAGEQISLEATLVADIPPFSPQTLGVLMASAEDQPLEIISVFDKSPAQRAGLSVGDLVLQLDGKPVTELDALRQQVMTLTPGGESKLRIQRGEETLDITWTAASAAGVWPLETPVLPGDLTAIKWELAELTLPDVPNKAAMLAPPAEVNEQPLGLLVVFAEPGEEELDAALKGWQAVAKKHRVIVAMLGSKDTERWNSEEAELAARLVAMINKRYRIQPHAVGVTGSGAGATLAIIAAFADPTTFSGFAVPVDVSPPAVQIRENDPSAPLHILIQRSGADFPRWVEVLRRVGYAIVDSVPERDRLMQFVWMLARV